MEPDFEFERAAYAQGFRRVAGVDEVGRGPLAGPVTAAAVVLDPTCIPEGLNDSKQLSIKRRKDLSEQLMGCAAISVAHASVEEIEQYNILQASHMAMRRALAGLPEAVDYVLIDGSMVPQELNTQALAVPKGDMRCLSISAASIVAKIARDRLMVDLAQQYPGYGWETNMGYGSKSHISALQNLGPTPHHRRTFKPVHNMLYQDKIVKP
ncbi:ribonuclease HII [Roseobacter cerasinus]|uniref:Ribonuclease HII n=1 Tax=Roseobacter cerasinus TaxID=2602289 RepID=A0A640VP47_9RHOB|nr:ribonuclease HII [Roseobacter cerasinus]GFE49210.1 ribonuclease HII [Roseobacter cerasinus]